MRPHLIKATATKKVAADTAAKASAKARNRLRSVGSQQRKETKTDTVPSKLQMDAAALKVALKPHHPQPA
jgi:hypothetical protein